MNLLFLRCSGRTSSIDLFRIMIGNRLTGGYELRRIDNLFRQTSRYTNDQKSIQTRLK